MYEIKKVGNFAGRFTLYGQNYTSTEVILPAKVQKHQETGENSNFLKKVKVWMTFIKNENVALLTFNL